jgi:hypothetical protein
MPNYIQQALHNFQHDSPSRPQHAPYPWQSPSFETKIQLTLPPDNTPLIDKKQITKTQQVLGALPYFSIGRDQSIP